MSILVSINCITYNHENFIEDAIVSFLKQQTNFDFEIIIGEDCSTDNTRKIIEKYVNLYPEKIKLITSEMNIGAEKNLRRIHEKSRGKFIALCEGDDFWTDPLKLQKQVEYMEENPECTLCFHNAKVIDSNKTLVRRAVVPWMKNNKKYYLRKNTKYSAGELALLGYIPTASFIYPKHLLDNPPQWCINSVAGDNVIKLITSSNGYAYYIDEYMSAYRFGVEGSSTTNWVKMNDTQEKKIKLLMRFIKFYEEFDRYSNYKYKNEIDDVKKIFEFQISVINGDWQGKKSRKYYKRILAGLDLKDKIIIYSRYYFPSVYAKLNKLRIFVLNTK
ncbi:glycosyltransferase [Peribacillus sp. NPDC097206]|uniref:glycosyltransferase n=1 Tax=unclassified Peribacillus TaxID=2675266 RepID=UPI00380906D1